MVAKMSRDEIILTLKGSPIRLFEGWKGGGPSLFQNLIPAKGRCDDNVHATRRGTEGI
jgi:hypothetical protein